MIFQYTDVIDTHRTSEKDPEILSCDFSLRRDLRNNDDEIQLYHMTRPDWQRLTKMPSICMHMMTIILGMLKVLGMLRISRMLGMLNILNM